jgi:hypothetical protein
MLSRDISNGNLMFRQNPKARTFHGVRDDFDGAVFYTKDPGHTSTETQRTGTLPYLALDLLSIKPPRHLFRHDLESCLWVLVWHAVLHDGKLRQKLKYTSLRAWMKTDLAANYRAKFAFLADQDVHFGTREEFKGEIQNVCFMLYKGKGAVHKFEAVEDTEAFETMGGCFTHELFMAQIESMIKKTS